MPVNFFPSPTLFLPRSISTTPESQIPDKLVEGCWSGGCKLSRDAIKSLPPPPRYLTPNLKEALITNHTNLRSELNTPLGDNRHYSSAAALPPRHMNSVAALSATAQPLHSPRRVISTVRRDPRLLSSTLPSQGIRGSPTGLQSIKFFPSRFRLPARAVRSGGPHAAETHWRATTD